METIGAIFVWLFFGLIVGLLGRLLVPGRQPMGWLGTVALGVVGSFAGGFLTYIFRGGEPLQAAGMLMSILGAIIVLAIYISMAPRRI
ncbi:GlsB/YeaQ/YmgE family stress response membrane protein [Planctomicrobium piriforme]|uniref:Uncharacterized membrane protein YeaQ/YmgE, transglycosylase-associated protein family n=1 Tax=Planctomicrobium piriforme TaxID=1576369 RepID=A0A1I3L4Q2_9PLAN|nr:GlsB/YeaQ/YmgE family stress response membrane protein [Planctomicrobium piriforme]SFI79682.1 Uncharacterized membrane protein YeaQ/YmgE, transglycosylase-associated protein family [Planctomicrobium piriforme]